MCICIADTWYLLHFFSHSKDGIADIGICHLIHVHCLHDLMDAKLSDGIGQPMQRVDTADADKQRILARKLATSPLSGPSVKKARFRKRSPTTCTQE